MKKKELEELAAELFHSMDNEGISYYFTQYGYDEKDFEKLGFDTKEISKAVEGINYLNSIYSDLEEMMGDE